MNLLAPHWSPRHRMKDKMYRLYARAGWGSVLVETQLAWYGLKYQLETVGDLFKEPQARDRLASVNPIAQIPTLILPDGAVMTESAAITLLLADITTRDDLAPGAGAPERARFLRWLIFMVANIYPTFTYGDDPARFVDVGRSALRARVDAYAQRLWGVLEAEAAEPWFLGGRFSAIDIFIAAMTQWRPQRPWFDAHAPKLAAIATGADALPQLASVWVRNFPPQAEPQSAG
ncbi:MAG: glutathione S-transferase family protein [Hyphomicrobiales bacterium]|nr:glutathione S-transferase family protein [Hyphomicrobiales bacterium]